MSLFRSARPGLKRVKNYVPGKPAEELRRQYGLSDVVKLASNENAWGPSPRAVRAAARALKDAHRYPDGSCYGLRKKLARALRVRPDSLVFGNGSDELLTFAVRSFAGPGDSILVADPTFLIYEIAAAAVGAKTIKVPMRNYRYDLEKMARRIERRTKVIFIANPDNPVGTVITEPALKAFLKKVPSRVIVVLDEAYYEFARAVKGYPRSLALVKRYRNLIVTRTFSKVYGLSGLRIGYGIAHPSVAEAMNRVREPFNVNRIAQAAAEAALEDRAFLERTLRRTAAGYRFLTASLERLGVRVIPTATNFVLADFGRSGRALYEKLLRRGVIVRSLAAWGYPALLRVTVGTPRENEKFIRELKKIL